MVRQPVTTEIEASDRTRREGVDRSADTSRRARVLEGSGVRWLITPPLLFLAALMALPLLWLVRVSASGGWDGFLQVLTDQIFLRSIQRTVMLSVVVTMACIILGIGYALGLLLAPKWLQIALFVSLLGVFWSPLLVRSYGWILLFQPRGVIFQTLNALGISDREIELYQTMASMYPAMIHVMLPFTVFPIYASLRGMDPNLIRAATTLGAGPLTTLRRVIVPQLRPGMIGGATFVFIFSLGFFVTPALLGGPRAMTVAMLINQRYGRLVPFSDVASMGLILLGTVLILYILADRAFGISARWGRH